MAEQNTPMKLAEMAYVYAKMKWMRTFKAFDLTGGCFAGNLIYASLLADSEENRNKLQQLANDFIQEEGNWGIFFDREEQEKIELGYELVFKAEDGKPTLKPIKAITWVGGIITDVQKLKVIIKG